MNAGIQGESAGAWSRVFRKRPVSAAIATWFGAGFLPVAPGTWGSLAALPFCELAYRAGGAFGLAEFAVGATLAGVVAAHRAAALVGKDPSPVVVDEVAGQAFSSLGVYAFCPRGGLLFPALLLVSFLLFRVVDVLKPGPVGRAESLPGGVGIMADDVLGGIASGLVMGTAAWLLRSLAA